MREARGRVEDLERDYERRIKIVEREKEKAIAAAKQEARELVERAAREADEALRELRKAGNAGGENKGTEAARNRLRGLREQVVKFEGADAPVVEAPKPHPSIVRGRLRARPKTGHAL